MRRGIIIYSPIRVGDLCIVRDDYKSKPKMQFGPDKNKLTVFRCVSTDYHNKMDIAPASDELRHLPDGTKFELTKHEPHERIKRVHSKNYIKIHVQDHILIFDNSIEIEDPNPNVIAAHIVGINVVNGKALIRRARLKHEKKRKQYQQPTLDVTEEFHTMVDAERHPTIRDPKKDEFGQPIKEVVEKEAKDKESPKEPVPKAAAKSAAKPKGKSKKK